MVDIGSKVFDTVYNAVYAAFPEARIDSGYVESTAKFPAVMVQEINNVPVRGTNTDDNSENYTRLTYEVDIHSDKMGEAMSEAKAIAKVADNAMKSLKFYRTATRMLPNQDRTIYRMYMRYEVIVREIRDGNGVLTGYQFYRREGLA